MARVIAILVVLALSNGCASLRAASAPRSAAEREESTTHLTAVEGRPGGLVLRLASEAPASVVELYRVAPEGEPELLQSIQLAGTMRESLASGLELVDSTVTAGDVLRYQLFAIDDADAVVAQSEVVEVTWHVPPPRIAEVLARAPVADAVELVWASAPEFGAVVFRRNVLDQDSKFERVVELSAGRTRWVDRKVKSGDVWSYRIALAFEHPTGLVQYGAASEEVYASPLELR